MPTDNFDQTLQHWNTALQILCISATTFCVALRVYTRLAVLDGLAKEDAACLGAWSLGVGYSAIALAMGFHGGGLPIENVSDDDERIFRKTVYGTMIIYGPAAYLTKVCLLWIMTRVFCPFRKAVILIYIFLGLMLAYYVPALIVKICICNPISKFWAPATPGSCLDQTKITLADAVISVASDLIVLIIPLALVSRLHLPIRKKIRVIALLGAGGLACASSIARLALIVSTGTSQDITTAFMRINMLGNAEISLGIICACLPSLSAFVTHLSHQHSRSHLSCECSQESSDHSRRRAFWRKTSDQEALVSRAQSSPHMRALMYGHGEHFGSRGDAIEILRTVEISTVVTSV
ncbi:integral membrane protein [Aspergillus bombycis]|uniref:Integral membrane protein n=1 Tax=Aspergillus bombycis TaxID=109264 RepID=A0A1F8ABV2_9EURO|nr:integral membrane protein [Aspergillus bombycis]OGM48838.1 integral membrane protein [Aspergillus bombycis]